MLELPISKKKISYRPFVVKEQKSLLLAQESKDQETVIATIKDVILSCTNNTLEFDKIPVADLAYFFVHLRIASVGPEVKFSIPCSSCEEKNIIAMSLNDIKLDGSKVKRDIKITPTVGIIFRLPTIEDAFDAFEDDDRSIKMLYNLIESIYDEDSVYSKEDYTEEEFREWIEMLNENQLASISEFIKSIPELKHELKFSCHKCKSENSRTLEGLHSFFRFDNDS
jgi:hypothetical protein